MDGGRVRGARLSLEAGRSIWHRHRQPNPILEWQRFPILRQGTAATGVPVRLHGDGLCMAIGGAVKGGGAGAAFMLGMVVSTGVGEEGWCSRRTYGGRTGNAGQSARSS